MTNEQQRLQWLEQRKNGIGGSDAAAIIGANPYKTSIELWEEKTGIREDDFVENEFTKYGKDAEAPLRELFILDHPQYEVTHDEFKVHQHEQYPFLQASLDGELVDKETGEYGILEIKTTNILQSMHREKWNGQIPQNYYIQVLHYMYVKNASFAILKAQLKTVYENEVRHATKHYTFRRGEGTIDNDIEYLIAREKEFWNFNVLQNVRPALILSGI
jgi:putative phage-type endonuclease